ncbi:MAG TPA: IS4 family transposase [Cellulomonadaceae bacterium]|nr:IS4 family transposase [Cellulomonadaceae bacterium]
MARAGQRIVGPDDGGLPGRMAVGVLTRAFPPGLVDEAVVAAQVGEQRTRILPARLVVYYVLAMIMFFQSSYSEVWVKLVGGLDWAMPFRVPAAARRPPSPAAISQARARLGWQVMADLLDRVAGPLAEEADSWAHVAGLRLVAVDGLTINVPDTAKNAAEFGRPHDGAGPGTFPQVRTVALAECGSRALLGARCAGGATSDQELMAQLIDRMRPGMLVLADRSFLSPRSLQDTIATGAHALFRAMSEPDLPVLGVLVDGTYISRISDLRAPRGLRRQGESGENALGISVRVIEYSASDDDGDNPTDVVRLVTDVIDPAQLSAKDAVHAFAQRWEIETVFGERGTGIHGDREVMLRSKSPDMIRQEVYAALCVYQAIRPLIRTSTLDATLGPDRFTCATSAVAPRSGDAGAPASG